MDINAIASAAAKGAASSTRDKEQTAQILRDLMEKDTERGAEYWAPAYRYLLAGLTMTTLHISAHLIDAGRGDHAEESAVFCDSILSAFGSVEVAAEAKTAAEAVFAKYEEWPADEASADEVAAYERWESAENSAHKAALVGWARVPDSAYFEVRFWSR